MKLILRSYREVTPFLCGQKGGKEPPKGTLSMGSLWNPSAHDQRGQTPLETSHAGR